MKIPYILKSFALLILVAGLATPHFIHAEVYKSVDKKGRVIYTDKPTPNSEKVEIKEANTIKSATVPDINDEEPPITLFEYQQLAITHPANKDIIPNGLVPFDISLNLRPKLQPEHQLQLLIDGQLHSTSLNNTFRVNSINRGQHKLQVYILDASGNRLKQSEVIEVFAYRP